ncbi:MAG: DinB family protein [Jatrophihabitans sp.]
MSQPVLPEPDAKDWTWTLSRACPECGFSAGEVSVAEVADIVEDTAVRFAARLQAPDAAARPEPATWSPVEYACHVRDVCAIFDGRFRQLLSDDDPMFTNWDQDETAARDRYWEQLPPRVADELTGSAGPLATMLRAIRDDELQRPGRRDNGSVFTVATLAQYLAHDFVHHLHDVGA